MTRKNPTLIFTGLAIAAVAALVGVTRDRWMPGAPAPVATLQGSTIAEQPAAGGGGTTVAETPAATEAPKTEQPAVTEAPKAEQPAVAEAPKTEQPAVAEAPKAEQPAVAEVPKTEQPAVAEAPKTEQPAVAEVPKTEQPAVAEAPKTEQPAVTEAPKVEQPAVTEAPKAEQPAAGGGAATTAEAPVTTQQQATAEIPKTDQQVTTEAPKTDQQVAIATGTTPSFDTVRVEKTGDAVIAGRAAAGSDVTVKLDGEAIGTAVANAEGSFVVVPEKPLPSGSGALTIEAKTKNQTVAMKSDQTVAVIVPAEAKQEALVAVVSPDQPTKILQKPEPAPAIVAEKPVEKPVETKVAVATGRPVSLDAVDYDDNGNIVFSGQGAPGAIARLYVDNTLAGDAKAGDDSRWSFAGSTPITAGVHHLRVDGLNAKGGVANRIEVPFFREETKKVAIAAPAVETPATTTTTAAATPVVPETVKPKDGRVVIQPGNNLWRISRVIYGTGNKYTVLYEANKEQIRNPDLIYPGQVFMTPDVVPPESIDPTAREPMKPEEVGASAQ